MSPTLDELSKDLAQIRIPMPGLPHLLRTLSDSEIDFDELTVALQQFSSVTARLLAVANSAWAAPLAPVTNLHTACTHLGLRLVRSISISVIVSSPFNALKCRAFDPTRFWFSSLLAADAAERLATGSAHSETIDPRTVYTAGLLHNIGLLWLADHHSALLASACEATGMHASVSLNSVLRSRIGADVGQVSAVLLRAWDLPAALTITVEHHRNDSYASDGWAPASMLGGATDFAGAIWQGQDRPVSRGLLRLGVPLGQQENVYGLMREKAQILRNLAGSLAGA